MPAVSVAQQRLMGQAYAVRTGKMKLSDVDSDYREEIKKLADGMTIQQLKDFAKTKHEDLPSKKESLEVEENVGTATVASVNGMGAPSMPGNPGSQGDFATQKTGSGDIPYSLVKGQPKKKKKSSFKSFNDFIKGSETLRSAF